jgi:hypothetical protein
VTDIPYDSTLDVLRHSHRVDQLMLELAGALLARVSHHDESKLQAPEKAIFDAHPPPRAPYGSPEYEAGLAAVAPAVAHHYSVASHHPQHHPHGVAGMTLVDLAELLADWAAAAENDDGELHRSLAIGTQRFGISDQLASVLVNTAREARWL